MPQEIEPRPATTDDPNIARATDAVHTAIDAYALHCNAHITAASLLADLERTRAAGLEARCDALRGEVEALQQNLKAARGLLGETLRFLPEYGREVGTALGLKPIHDLIARITTHLDGKPA